MLTINGKLAVCVENQLLYLHIFGLFQGSAGCLCHKQTTSRIITVFPLHSFSIGASPQQDFVVVEITKT